MKRFKSIIKYIIGDEKRQVISIPLLAIVCSLLVASILLLGLGYNPLIAFRSILAGAGLLPRPSYIAGRGMFTDLMLTLTELTPMVFASLAVVVALKGGLFNIGVSGQMLLSGYIASLLIGYSDLPAIIAKPLVLLIGIICGAAVGILIGWLKSKYNINEVVSSIMLNYIIMFITSYFIFNNHVDPLTRQSTTVSPASLLVFQNVEIGEYRTTVPIIIILALAMVFALKFFINRTKAGFDLQAVGSNPVASKYLGISPTMNRLLAMTISGALAGLAGVTYYLGLYPSIPMRELPSIGFDAIAVALLGNATPVGAMFASVLVTVISRGAMFMSSTIGVQREITQVITALILLFSACGAYIKQIINREG